MPDNQGYIEKNYIFSHKESFTWTQLVGGFHMQGVPLYVPCTECAFNLMVALSSLDQSQVALCIHELTRFTKSPVTFRLTAV